MAESREQVKQDIERTREDLGYTLDALGQKVSPKQAARRRIARIRSAGVALKDRVMGSAGDAGTGVSEQAPSMTDRASGVTEAAGERAAQVKDAVTERASAVTEAASERAGQAVEAVKSTPQVVRRQTEGNPFAAGIIAFGAGLLAGSLLPKTRTEEQLGPKVRENIVEPVKSTATEVGQELKSSVQESARTATEEVKSTAQEAAGQVKETAQQSAQDVKEHAQQSTEQVRSEVTS